MTESTYKIFDNWLEEDDFNNLRDSIIFNNKMPLYFIEEVAYPDDHPNYTPDSCQHLDCWYAVNNIYAQQEPRSKAWPEIKEMFYPAMEKAFGTEFRDLLRIKVNFYPRTHEIFEHPKHKDYPFSCPGAVLSLNTCDGFTRLADGTKLDSVANRLVAFDSGENHNSTTTTNAKGRYNININWL